MSKIKLVIVIMNTCLVYSSVHAKLFLQVMLVDNCDKLLWYHSALTCIFEKGNMCF